MTKHIRILIMVAFAVAVLTGTAAAYDGENSANELTMKTITITDGTNSTVVSTLSNTVAEVFEEKKIEIDDKTTVSKDLTETIKNGDEIVIKRPYSITLKINSESTPIVTNKSTVGDIINEYSSLIGSEYELQDVTESTRLYNNMVIKVLVTTDEIVTTTEKIPFETKKVENPDLDEGTERVTQEGKNGIAEITKKQYYFDGKIQKVEEVGREVIQEPVDKIIEIGTKKETVVEQVSIIDGLVFKKAINMVSTAYTPYDSGCTGITASGIAATKGVAAVDTSVIPFGTKLYIPGYGVAVAADTGGAINGNRIDLCYNTLSEAYGWGRRNVTVYILE